MFLFEHQITRNFVQNDGKASMLPIVLILFPCLAFMLLVAFTRSNYLLFSIIKTTT